ncbi:unnamed protein product [Tuber melanosporum]|uniref:(Perigord truffle) hypothetical protein n=1 Tax=Tuber melanosporum (strain Mel28) TaxID=656061 RepID=D5GKV9_TUBMM|nr:uncharacterized protein GSTUM_00009789001 [Tuber melanosporum]CAZ85152.1 unnamed protein product [Tuber melanosporum]
MTPMTRVERPQEFCQTKSFLASSGWVLDDDVEHLGEVLAEAVGCRTLNSTAGGRDVSLAGGGEEASGELLLLSLTASDGWDSEELRVNACVPFENL